MSVRVMSLVWQHFPRGGSDLLTLLALADWGQDDGSNIYPSVAAVAQKIRASESQARRILHALVEEKYLSVVGNESGGAPGTTRLYQINLDRLTGSMDARGGMDARGSTHARRRVAPMRETGSTHATLTIIKPLIEPLGNSKGGDAKSLPSKKAVELSNKPTLPGYIDKTLWDEFKQNRKSLKAPVTELAEKRLLVTLAKLRAEGQDANAVISRSIEHGWKGLFPIVNGARDVPDRVLVAVEDY